MRLRLNTTLAAALIAAYAVSGAYATTTKTTTYEGGTVFNGDIWTWNNANEKNVSSGDSQYTNYTTGQTYAGNANMTSVGGADAFWKMIQFTSETDYVGNTLRFADATGNVRLNTDYAKYVWVGGIITEAGNSGTYTLGRNSDTSFYLKGNQPVNMIINSNFTFWATNANNSAVEIGTGGTWTVADGKVLEFNVPSVKHHANQTVNINGTGTVKFTKSYTGQAGAIFNVGEGATLTFAQAAQLGGTITNNGTVNFNGAVSLSDSLSGFEFEKVGYYVDDQGIAADNGFYSGTIKYTIVKGNAATGLTSVQHGQDTYTVEGGKITIGSEGQIDKTTLWVNKGSETFSPYAEAAEGALANVILANGTTIVMDSEASVTASVAAGADNTTISATKDITLTSLAGPEEDKTLTISAADHTVAVQGDNSFMGNIVVDKGIVKLDSAAKAKSLGAFNGNNVKGQPAAAPNKTITINDGGTIDLNGMAADLTYVYTLNGGSLVNKGANISNGSMQTVGLILTKNSTIGGTGNFYLLGPGYDNTFVTLDNYKLTKIGNNTVGFRNTAVSDGSIEVQAGNIEFIKGDNSKLAADVILNGGNIVGETAVTDDINITVQKNTSTNVVLNIASGKHVTLKSDGDYALTFGNGLTVKTGAVDVSGTVNVNSKSLDLSSGKASVGVINVLTGGEMKVNAGMWLHTTAAINLEEDGVFNIGALQIVGKENGEGSILATAENQEYSTGNANIKISNATISAMGNVTIGNTLVNTDVVTGEHTVTLNSNAANVIVSDGGSFTKGNGFTVDSVTVEGTGTVSGMDISDVTLESGAIATFADEYYVVAPDDNVYMFNSDSPVVIENIGNTSAKYTGLHQEGMKVTADMLSSSADGVTVQNTVAVTSISHEGGALTLQHVDADALQNVEVAAGALSMQNITNVTLTEMDIASGATVQAVYTDEQMATVEGTVTISQALTAGGGTLLANLTLVGGSMLNVEGGGNMAMTLGSTLTIDLGNGGFVNLDQATIDALNSLQNGERLNLIVGTPTATLDYAGNAAGAEWYNDLFYRPEDLVGDYKVYTEGGAFGLEKQSSVPEPTTGTLSLLALAALAARRRRK